MILLEVLSNAGVDLEGQQSLVALNNLYAKKKAKYDDRAISALLDNLDKAQGLMEFIAGLNAFRLAKNKFNGAKLATIFMHTTEPNKRSNIAGTIADTLPEGIENWTKDVLLDESIPINTKFSLYSAYAQYNPSDAFKLLEASFQQAPIAVAIAWGHIGGEKELSVLEDLLPNTKGWDREQVKKSIQKIQRRIERGAKSTNAPSLSARITEQSGLSPELRRKNSSR